MKKIYSTLILTFVTIIFLASCSKKTTSTFSFAFYNVENLFDTINDPNIDDESYLPDSKVAWNTERYSHKLDNLTKVIKNLDTTGFPAIFGLCEVENIDVLHDLINHNNLKGANYSIVHKNSPDERGIDVALLYNPMVYSPIVTIYIRPDFPTEPDHRTRDILYSKGVVNKSDTMHIFINHWVSRWGGQEKTEPARIQIAKTIKGITDSILSLQPKANILIAGDLNDNPTDISILEVLRAQEVTDMPVHSTLYNLSLKQFREGNGSLYYKSWDMFDQIIVSTSLLDGSNGLKTSSEQTVFKQEWMLYQPKKGPARPSRTASGGRYYGGYSDHLPVLVKIQSN